MMRKQFAFDPFQVVQKPSLVSFQVPSPLAPPVLLTGSRVTLPSAVNTILNLTFDGVAAVNGVPVKKVAWMSFGASTVAAIAVATTPTTTAPAMSKLRMGGPPSDCAGQIIPQFLREATGGRRVKASTAIRGPAADVRPGRS